MYSRAYFTTGHGATAYICMYMYNVEKIYFSLGDVYEIGR